MTHLLYLSNVTIGLNFFYNIYRYSNLFFYNIYRYSNLYCAICNDVKDIRYWRVDVGCLNVANDKCNYAPESVSQEILFLSNILFRKNPTITELRYSE